VINLARVRSTRLPASELIDLTCRYRVKAVVFTYDLSGSGEYVQHVRNNFIFYKAFNSRGRSYANEGSIPLSGATFFVYYRPQAHSDGR